MIKFNVEKMRKAALSTIPDRVEIYLDPLDSPHVSQDKYEKALHQFEQAALSKYGPYHTITVTNMGRDWYYNKTLVILEMRPNRGKVKIVNTIDEPRR